jgi:hypothetical protein
MIHPGPETASSFRLYSAGAPPLLLAQVSPGGAGDLVAWAMAAAAALCVTVGTVALVQHRRAPWRARHRAHDVLVLFAPPGPQSPAPVQEQPLHPRPAAAPADTASPAVEPEAPAAGSTAPAAPAAEAPARPPRVGPVQARRAPRRPAADVAADGFPADGTLQVLPGRLEVLAGLTLDNPWEQEIRFVQIPGSEPVITLGRGEGPPHRHLRLDSATVSREQAHMRFGGGGWTLTNLSRTNPTSVNGEALAPGAATVLREGDRIEMGEVAFRFRER